MISADDLFANAGLSNEHKQACFEFFVLFSRFEYALKRWGCADPHSDALKVNWDIAGKKLSEFCEELLREVTSDNWEILGHPPKKQFYIGGGFEWEELDTSTMNSKTRRILLYICTVRNNLFHGGKWPEPKGPVIDVARNLRLIHESTTLLSMIVESAQELRDLYFEFA